MRNQDCSTVISATVGESSALVTRSSGYPICSVHEAISSPMGLPEHTRQHRS
jgi:hypothetical protein